MAELDPLFVYMVGQGASDLHMSTAVRPMIRLHGSMMQIESEEVLTAERMERLYKEITPEKNQREFKERWDTDFAYELPGTGRFRANLFMDRMGPGMVFRHIPDEILTAEKLGLSPAICELTTLAKGLVLVTGPTGSGKSTTLCAMIDLVNRTRTDHIITIEDPIEFVHPNKKCLINQREVNTHTKAFKSALRAALREDPDILLVGELRDLETIEIALEMAETGHLVFGTLHTTTAGSTVERVVDQFPEGKQPQVRQMLGGSLKGVIAQTLCKKADGKGRVAALEVLIGTPALSAVIREGKTHQIPNIMQTGGKYGMVQLNDGLAKLVRSGTVTPEEAMAKAVDRESLHRALQDIPGMAKRLANMKLGDAPAAATATAAPSVSGPAGGMMTGGAPARAATPAPAAPPRPRQETLPAEAPAGKKAAASFDDFDSFRKSVGK